MGDEVGAHDHRLEETPRADTPAGTEPGAPGQEEEEESAESHIPQGKEEKRTGQDCSEQPELGQKASATHWMKAKVGSAGGRGASSSQQRAHCTGNRENTSDKEGP